ncbi:MAG TPA: tetratricopeptide repeat protein [Flavitalea sp.]|nr:tetratricopeptide repeat protein [Flavitalea sp.]
MIAVKIIVSVLLGLHIIAPAIAQNDARDSLIRIIKTQKQDSNKVRSLIALASLYNLTKPDTTVRLSVEALELAKSIGDDRSVRNSLEQIAGGYHILGNYAKALQFYLQALKLAEKSNDTQSFPELFNGIGHVYLLQDNYEEALIYMHKGLAIDEKMYLLAHTCEIFVQMKNADSARYYGHKSLGIAYKDKDPAILSWALFEMAYAHLVAEEYSLALEYFRMSIPLTDRDNYFSLCKQYRGIAQVFGKIRQQDSSLYYSRLALLTASQNKMLHEAEKASSFLASFFRAAHNSDSALFYMDLSKKINDSLFSQQNRHQLFTLTIEEELRQIEQEELQRKEKERRKDNLQYAAIVFGLLTLLIGFLVFSHSIIAKPKLIKILGVVSLLIVFEFVNLSLHPYLGDMTHHSPILMLLIMVGVAALLVPLHHKLENWITQKLVEKNKRIRLAAAKKTIAELES